MGERVQHPAHRYIARRVGTHNACDAAHEEWSW
jgi:hypothetical protein